MYVCLFGRTISFNRLQITVIPCLLVFIWKKPKPRKRNNIFLLKYFPRVTLAAVKDQENSD